jgi:hypothetical protein
MIITSLEIEKAFPRERLSGQHEKADSTGTGHTDFSLFYIILYSCGLWGGNIGGNDFLHLKGLGIRNWGLGVRGGAGVKSYSPPFFIFLAVFCNDFWLMNVGRFLLPCGTLEIIETIPMLTIVQPPHRFAEPPG